MLHNIILYYVILYYIMLCYIMLCYILYIYIFFLWDFFRCTWFSSYVPLSVDSSFGAPGQLNLALSCMAPAGRIANCIWPFGALLCGSTSPRCSLLIQFYCILLMKVFALALCTWSRINNRKWLLNTTFLLFSLEQLRESFLKT